MKPVTRPEANPRIRMTLTPIKHIKPVRKRMRASEGKEGK